MHKIYAIAKLKMMALLSIKIKKIERSDSTNIQSSIFNSGSPGRVGQTGTYTKIPVHNQGLNCLIFRT
ncbi:hypothetical protein D1AOALGA4SA_8543 [Olavius algarvensis Delta 1 endosymbiont]|nr:hypothetical protein D1AOALGA4SA_8543 [Olavius algarvensis Delta 1 endosymbiont]